MKTLLSTTAMVVALGFPALSLAQATDTNTAESQRQNTEMSGFLSTRDRSDIFASELMGQDVYARGEAQGGNQSNTQTNSRDNQSMMARADLDNMENIGQINEIVLSNDGQVLAVVVGVGGFLGLGEQDVAVTMDQISFSHDSEDQSQMYVIMNADAGMLMDAPAYDRTMAQSGEQRSGEMRTDEARTDQARSGDAQGQGLALAGDAQGQGQARAGDAQGQGQVGNERARFTAPNVSRDGFERVEIREVSTEMLMGEDVYDLNDNSVGSVTDMLIDDGGAVSHVIIDFGGFLGIGVSQTSINYDELTVLSNEGYSDVLIYVDATKEQIQELPSYMKDN